MTLFSTYLKLSYRLGITKHTVNELKNWDKHYVDTTLLYYYHENENFKVLAFLQWFWFFCNMNSTIMMKTFAEIDSCLKTCLEI